MPRPFVSLESAAANPVHPRGQLSEGRRIHAETGGLSWRGTDKDESNWWGYSRLAEKHTFPFPMAMVNTRIVRRSNALLGHSYGTCGPDLTSLLICSLFCLGRGWLFDQRNATFFLRDPALPGRAIGMHL